MATKTSVLALAEELGAEVIDSGTTIELEAPAGCVNQWGTHAYTYDVISGRAGVWNAIMDDLKQGFEACAAADCEWCE